MHDAEGCNFDINARHDSARLTRKSIVSTRKQYDAMRIVLANNCEVQTLGRYEALNDVSRHDCMKRMQSLLPIVEPSSSHSPSCLGHASGHRVVYLMLVLQLRKSDGTINEEQNTHFLKTRWQYPVSTYLFIREAAEKHVARWSRIPRPRIASS